MAKGFITLGFGHNSFAFKIVCDFIVAASNQQISIWEPMFIMDILETKWIQSNKNYKL